MQRWPYTKGLHDLGNGCYAYLQPDGAWGYSNSGLIVEGSETLLVDTLMDLKLTREMLDRMRAAAPASEKNRDACEHPFQSRPHEWKPASRGRANHLFDRMSRRNERAKHRTALPDDR